MNPSTFNIFYHPGVMLRLTIPNEKSYIKIKPVWAAPLTRPGKHLVLMDSKDNEIIMLRDPKVLSHDSWIAVQEELHQRYLTASIIKVYSAHEESGATYWDVETNRGRREFITQGLQEHAQWMGDNHLLLLDVDACRYEITSIGALDTQGQQIVWDVV